MKTFLFLIQHLYLGYNNGGYRAPGRSLKSGSSSGKSSGPVEFSAGIRALPGATSKA